MLREWEINHRKGEEVIKQFVVKKHSYHDAHRAACELFPDSEIIAIVEGDLVVEDEQLFCNGAMSLKYARKYFASLTKGVDFLSAFD